MNKKVLFLFPNTSIRGRIATAIPILAAIARHRGWEAVYFDTTFYAKDGESVIDREQTGGFKSGPKETIPELLPENRLVPDLQKFLDTQQPNILAIMAMTCEYQYLFSFFPKIRIPPNTIVIIGGLHSTFEPEQVMASGLFDMACLGQGEGVFDELLTKIDAGEPIDHIQGTYFRAKGIREIIRNPKRPLLSAEQLWQHDEVYSFYDDRYFIYPFDGRSTRVFWADLGRGCPYACSYCGNTVLKKFNEGLGQYIVTRPLDSTFRLLRRMVRDYKVEVFNLINECFLAQPASWLEEFAERWAKDVRKTFLIATRAETITEEKLRILKKSAAPIAQISLGVESGSERILREVCNRKMRNETTIRAFRLMAAHGFRTSAYWMVGLPFETREDIFKSIELCAELDADVDSVSIFQPMPGQPLTKICVDNGFIRGDEPIPTYTSDSILKMPQISSREISQLRRVFILYAKLPKSYWPQIEKCEKDFNSNEELFEKLVRLRWDLAGEKTKHSAEAPQ